MIVASGSLALTLVSLAALLAGYVFLFGLWWFVFRDGKRQEKGRRDSAGER